MDKLKSKHMSSLQSLRSQSIVNGTDNNLASIGIANGIASVQQMPAASSSPKGSQIIEM